MGGHGERQLPVLGDQGSVRGRVGIEHGDGASTAMQLGGEVEAVVVLPTPPLLCASPMIVAISVPSSRFRGGTKSPINPYAAAIVARPTLRTSQ